jgi:hypothetical protein
MIIGCICGGILELTFAIILGISGLFGITFEKFKRKKHGVHGDDKCDCECHKNHKDLK